MDIPPHLEGEWFGFATSATLASDVVIVHPVLTLDNWDAGGDPRAIEVWPLLTEYEQRLVLAASLLLTDGADDMDGLDLFGTKVLLWQDHEVWVPIHKIRERFKERGHG